MPPEAIRATPLVVVVLVILALLTPAPSPLILPVTCRPTPFAAVMPLVALTVPTTRLWLFRNSTKPPVILAARMGTAFNEPLVYRSKLPLPSNSKPVFVPVPVVMLAPEFSMMPFDVLLRITLPVPLFTVPAIPNPPAFVSFNAKSPWVVKLPRLVMTLLAWSSAAVVPMLPTKLTAVITPVELWLILPAEFSVTVPPVASVTAPFRVMLLPVVAKVMLVPVTEPVLATVKAPVLVMLASPALLVVTAPVTVSPGLLASFKVNAPVAAKLPRLPTALVVLVSAAALFAPVV